MQISGILYSSCVLLHSFCKGELKVFTLILRWKRSLWLDLIWLVFLYSFDLDFKVMHKFFYVGEVSIMPFSFLILTIEGKMQFKWLEKVIAFFTFWYIIFFWPYLTSKVYALSFSSFCRLYGLQSLEINDYIVGF